MSSASGLCNTGDHPLPPGTTKEVPRFFFLMRRTVTIPNLDGLYLPLLDKGIVWLSNLKKEYYKHWSFPRWCSGKESTCQWGRHRRFQFNPWIGKISWRRKYPPMLVLLFFFSGKSHGQRSLVGYSSWGCKELDITEHQQTNTFCEEFYCL